MNVSAAIPDKSLFRRLLLPNSSSGLASFNRNDQLIYCSLTTLAGSTLLLARWLTPSANGFGTHEQLGLPPCFFFKLTGIPCPSCGLTTSFAHSARLHFYQAFITHPFGVIAFCLTVVGIPLLLYLLRRRITWANFIRAKGVDYLIYFLIATYLLSWLYKIAAVKWLAS